jgi:hypothetical protein
VLTLLLATLLASPNYSVRSAAFEYLYQRPDPIIILTLWQHPDPEVRDKAHQLLPQADAWAEYYKYGRLPYLDSLPDFNQNPAHRQCLDDCRIWMKMRDWSTGGAGKWAEYRMATGIAIEIGVLWPDGQTWLYMEVRSYNWDKLGRWE